MLDIVANVLFHEGFSFLSKDHYIPEIDLWLFGIRGHFK